MGGAAESALEDLTGLDFLPLGALVDLVADDLAALADDSVEWGLGQLLEQDLRVLEVLVHEDLGVVVRAPASLLAVPVHVVPAQLAHDVLVLAQLAQVAEPHVEVRAGLVHVPVVTVLSLVALLFDEVLADLQVVAEVASLPVRALPPALILLAGLDLALVVRVRARLSLPALAVDKLLADSIGGQLGGVVGSGGHASGHAIHASHLVGPMVALVAHHLPHRVAARVGSAIGVAHLLLFKV
ncbi:MAG: hypothetical protein H7A36_08015 [Chlamydiales bacterium]|nr:hypothetical protein [Chlamydiales bacterium]